MSSVADVCGHTARKSLGRSLYQMDPGNIFSETDSCQRETWEGSQKCILHAEGEGKPPDKVSRALNSGRWLFDLQLQNTKIQDVRLTGESIVNSDFRQVIFSDVAFHDCDLWGVYFTGAVVNQSGGGRINFSKSRIRQSDFRRVGFSDTDFRKTSIPHTRFDGARLDHANFNEANLYSCNFNDTNLDGCTFLRSGLYQTSFKDAQITQDTEFGASRYEIPSQFRGLMISQEDPFEEPLTRAVWQNRMLSALHRENSMPSQAKRHYTRAKDAQRRLYRKERQYLNYIKAEASRWITFYGESPFRVVFSSMVVVVGSGILYKEIGEVVRNGDPVTSIIDLMYFSIVTFSTLGYGDMQPGNQFSRVLAGTEGFIGALMMALLVFVLGRRVTR